MDRAVSDRNVLDDFCEQFCNVVDKHCKYVVVSGYVAISTGRVRGTEDIDMIIEPLSKDSFLTLHEDLLKIFDCTQTNDANTLFSDYLSKNSSVRYILKDKLLPEMEVKFAKDQVDHMSLNLRTKIPLTGLDVWFAPVSMGIAYKEEFLKSVKDLEDAQHLRRVFDEISEHEILEFKKLIREVKS